MGRDYFDWTEERLTQLRSLRNEGVSISNIGRRLGVSRSAVAGMLRRQGLACSSRSPIRVRAWTELELQDAERRIASGQSVRSVAAIHNAGAASLKAALARKAKSAGEFAGGTESQIRLAAAYGPGQGVGLALLREGMCRWPLWGHKDRPSFRCCGAESIPGKPYCAGHYARAFTSAPRREKAA